MRARPLLVIIAMLTFTPAVNAQTAAAAQTGAAQPTADATQPAAAKPAATETESAAAEPAVTQPAFAPPVAGQPVAVSAGEPVAAHATRPSRARPSPSKRTSDTRASAPAVKSDAVLDLGATDITGNKELPKVMVIVPWKDSLGAGGVVKPTDSLMDEVLQPVDRGVFQRRIRYYGQLKSTGGVAPVGDSH